MLLMRNQQGKFEDVSEVSGEPFETRQAARAWPLAISTTMVSSTWQ
jgi:hypothetical protein